jgi:mannose-6-phosphate isomerase-like protein (cupin superfamily)
MYVKKKELKARIVEHMMGGRGCFIIEDILAPDQMKDKGRLFARGTLPPGSSVGRHAHDNDTEICYFLSGKGVVILNDGTKVEISPGDCNIVGRGSTHEIINTGTENLEYIAVILFI